MVRVRLEAKHVSDICVTLFIGLFTGVVTFYQSKLWLDYHVVYLFRSAIEIADGAIPHREILITHGVMTAWTQALFILIFGKTQGVLYLSTWFFLFLLQASLYFSFRMWVPRWLAIMGALVLLTTYPGILFTWPNYYAAGCIGVALWLLSQYIETKRSILVFLAGILTGILFFYRQQLGIIPFFAIIGILLCWPFGFLNRKEMLSTASLIGLGALLSSMTVILILKQMGAWNDFVFQYIEDAGNNGGTAANSTSNITNELFSFFIGMIKGTFRYGGVFEDWTMFTSKTTNYGWSVFTSYSDFFISFAVICVAITRSLTRTISGAVPEKGEGFFFLSAWISLFSMVALYPVWELFRGVCAFGPGFYLAVIYFFKGIWIESPKSRIVISFFYILLGIYLSPKFYRIIGDTGLLMNWVRNEGVSIDEPPGFSGIRITKKLAATIESFEKAKKQYMDLYPDDTFLIATDGGNRLYSYFSIGLPRLKKIPGSDKAFGYPSRLAKLIPKYLAKKDFHNFAVELANAGFNPIAVCDADALGLLPNYLPIFKEKIVGEWPVSPENSMSLGLCVPVERARRYYSVYGEINYR
ncbi:MAG: hypothetical protein HQK54_00860 [Oligoflexales bacterium]|nr:hypothetical protein [Oligoflexales bacterium]